MEAPQIDTITAIALLNSAKQKATEVSKGKLTDLTEASPVTAILEAVSLIGTEVITKVNALASTLEANRISYFGVEKFAGKASVGTVQVNLTGVYAETFSLPVGFKFTCNGIEFELTQPVTIEPYQLNGTATAISLSLGSDTNVSGSIAFSPVPKVASLEWAEVPTGGQDEESEESWRNRILGTLRRRDTLISEDDFEEATRNYLGTNSVALAVGRLKPNLVNYENGYVAVFGLNPDGTELTNAQRSYLESSLNRRAAMAQINVFSVNLVEFNLRIIAGYEDFANLGVVSEAIALTIKNYLRPGNLELGRMIFNKAIERRVMNVSGVIDGNVSVTLNGLAQPLALPNAWSVGKLKEFRLVLVNNGVENSYDFSDD